ncbi:50S ribosomal protein L11 methyltransferase, partial [Arthrospira platensis SPKY1]|nr:50S ribosomal protein L11 methyltransferase [Arthrospira platensis SPKY1]
LSSVPERVLVIDPEMAFGYGSHQSTQLCLQLIEDHSSLVGKDHFLDVGTGTGVLALLAALEGFKTVHGIDCDPLAIEVACRNAAINSIKCCEFSTTDLRELKGTWNMV